MPAYYNEFKPEAAHMLRQLIKDGLIAAGDVDERSIMEVKPDDLQGYTQHHFFAGIGGWSVALRLAGWRDDNPVWTGSCPCQPFSTAGKQKGKADERHLWPIWFNLIRECRPWQIYGEQVSSAIAHGWWDDVANDLEGEDYACGAAVLPACSVGKPHKRDRLWFVAHSESERGSRTPWSGCSEAERPQGDNSYESGRAGTSGTMGNTELHGSHERTQLRGIGESKEERRMQQLEGSGTPSDVADPAHIISDERISGNDSGERRGNERSLGTDGSVLDVADTNGAGLQGHGRHEQQYDAQRRKVPYGYSGQADLRWIKCPDGKSRPVKYGIPLLAHGIQHRTPILHALGNAIVPQVAAEFIKATM